MLEESIYHQKRTDFKSKYVARQQGYTGFINKDIASAPKPPSGLFGNHFIKIHDTRLGEECPLEVCWFCGFSGHAHGVTFLIGKDDGNGGNSCYEPGVSRPRWNTASGVREEDFCYGGCQNSTGFGIYQDTEEYICATLHGHEICKQNKTLTYEIAKLRHRVWLLESNIDKFFERSGETMTPIQISDGKEYIERRELTKMFIPAILVSMASFIAFTTSLYQIFRANQRVRHIYSNFTGD